MVEEDENIQRPDVVGIVYDPPRKGFPLLTAIFIDGKMVVSEPVRSIEEGEALIAVILPEIPDLMERARQKARRRKTETH